MSLLRDLLTQFLKLSEEADVSVSENEVTRVTEQLNELNELLSARRAAVQVHQSASQCSYFRLTQMDGRDRWTETKSKQKFMPIVKFVIIVEFFLRCNVHLSLLNFVGSSSSYVITCTLYRPTLPTS